MIFAISIYYKDKCNEKSAQRDAITRPSIPLSRNGLYCCSLNQSLNEMTELFHLSFEEHH